MEEIRITFEKDGMQFEVSTTSEHYTQAVYALIEAGFERFNELDKSCLLGVLYKAIDLYPEVSECNIEANESAKRLRSRAVAIKDSVTQKLAKVYCEGYIDGIDDTMKLY